MLSLYTLKSAADASTYYQQGDYYTQGGADEYSHWLGKGAERLNLNGPVDFAVFSNLLEGRLPNGVLMKQTEKGGYHRPGYDLTFSAPKSVSILALVSKSEVVLEAHREAVQKTLDYFESKYAGCRNKNRGVMTVERTANFTVAAFEHSDSRAGDPALHTHCVLMNVTQRANGDWRTVFADEFYTHVLLNGKIYDSHLAQGLMQRGFELEVNEKGNFEIKSVPEDIIHFYSKRRQEIESWLKENNLSGSKAAETANFFTRGAKVSLNPEERTERWIEELHFLGSSIEKMNEIVEKAKERGPVLAPDPVVLAENAIHSAINHLSEKRSSFSFQELIKTAKLISLLPVNEGDLLEAIEKKIGHKGLIYLENKLLTTVEVMDLEQKNVASMRQEKETVDKMLPQWIASLVVPFKTGDTLEQEALVSLLSNNDCQVLLSGNSKVIMDQTLKNYIEISSAQKFYPRVLVQNKMNVERFKNQLKTERVATIEGFLLACEERADKRGEPQHLLEAWDRRIKRRTARDVWIVHGDISTRQLNRLGHWAEEFGARVVLTELKKCSTLESLKTAGIAEIKLRATKDNIVQLQSQTVLLREIKRLEKTNHILVVKEEGRQSSLMGRLSANPSERLLITLTAAESFSFNQLARQALKETGVLQGPAHLVKVLRPLNLSVEEKSWPHLYQPGDVIRFNRALPETSIKESNYFTVHQVNLERGIIELNQGVTQISWDPLSHKTLLKHLEVFKPEDRTLQVGECLVWNRTVKELNRIKGERAWVTAIEGESISLKLKNGLETTLEKGVLREQHWEYGYAVHLKEAEFQSAKNLTVVLEDKALNAKNILRLSDLLIDAKAQKIPTEVVCCDLPKLIQAIQSGGYRSLTLDPMIEAPYQREKALENYQTLATEPLFNRLHSEYLKMNQSNSDLAQASHSDVVRPELRIACDVVDKIALYHSEREAVFGVESLMKHSVQLGALMTSVEAIEEAIQLAFEKGWLIPTGKNSSGEKLVTTKHTLLIEKLCIQKMQEGKNKLKPILTKESSEIQPILNHRCLTEGQKEAVQLILTTPDRMVAIQGVAGAGKTTALKEIKRLCESNHYTLVLANTGSAKNQAKFASGIAAKTTAQFLTHLEKEIEKDLNQAKKDHGGNRLFILDESSLTSARDLLRLQRVVEQLDAKLALVGDFKQQGSIGAGVGFLSLLAYGIDKAVMRENVRLKDATAFSAMKQAYQGDIKGTLVTLKHNIEEIPNKTEALERIVTAYFAVSPLEKDLLIITPLNKDRLFVNHAIREKLKEQGVLTEGQTVNVFVSTDKREVGKRDIFSYQSQDVIRFNTHQPRLGVQAGDYADILHIDLKHQRLTLKIEGKESFYWSPKNLRKPEAIEIYRREQREFSRNDIIVFKRNFEKQGIFNGDKATVLKIEHGKADFLLFDGNTVRLDLTQAQNQHLEYGYALTTYAAQGKDVKFVIAYLEGLRELTRKTTELKIGDVIVLPKEELQSSQYPGEHSKVVKVQAITEEKLILNDKNGHVYEMKANKEGIWSYFPPSGERKEKDFPLSTSQESLIIDITRGDGLLLIVPYLEDCQKILEKHQQLKMSALSHLDPNWQKRQDIVHRLVEDIKGKSEIVELKQTASQKEASESVVRFGEKHKTLSTEPFRTPLKGSFIDKDEINQRLERDILGYATQWLGNPSSVSGREARWGRKGSLSLTLNGPRIGCWSNWETHQKGGDLISLYMNLYSVPFKDAIQELAKNTGLKVEENSNFSKVLAKSLKEESKSLKNQIALAREKQERVKKALDLYNKAIPIYGTLAERYLREHRGILGELPNDFRFLKADKHLDTHRYVPALIAPYRDKDNQMVGVVRIYLNADGSKYSDTFTDARGEQAQATSKANRGVTSHGLVRVQEGLTERTLWVAEGIETALSVATAVPTQTVVASISAGQISTVPIGPETQKVIICADNDPASSETKKSVIKAVESFLSQGVRTFIALPPSIPEGMKKYDFNDLLKDHGLTAVEHSLNLMVEIKDAGLLKMKETRLESNLNQLRLENTRYNEKLSSPSLERRLNEKVKEMER